MKKREEEILLCQCHSIEHSIIFVYDVDDSYPEVYMNVHLSKRNIWNRIRYSFKYIFGYRCRFGAFEEMVLNKDDIPKLEKLIKYLKKTN